MGGLRYLKKCLQAFPFSLPAVLCSFAFSLLAWFFRSSAQSLAQASVSSYVHNRGDYFFSEETFKTLYFFISICFIFTLLVLQKG